MAKKKAKKKIGRPPQYKSRYCRMLVNFFSIEPFTVQRVQHYDESGKKHRNGQRVVAWTEIKKEPNRTPTLQRFAKKIKVGISTVYDWLNEEHASFHKGFSDAFARAREARKFFLIENALHRNYEPSTFKYVANNLTDMTETQKHEVTGAEGGPIKSQIKVVHFAKANIDNDTGGSPSTD